LKATHARARIFARAVLACSVVRTYLSIIRISFEAALIFVVFTKCTLESKWAVALEAVHKILAETAILTLVITVAISAVVHTTVDFAILLVNSVGSTFSCS
jgi:hypothetical protein